MRVLQVAASAVSLAKFALPLMRELRDEGWEVEALAGFDGHEGQIHNEGFRVHRWQMGHSMNPLVISRARKQLASLLHTRPFDLTHSHCSFGGVVANPVAFRRTRKLLYTQHGFYVHDGLSATRRRLWLEIEKVGLRHAHHVICVSQAERKLALSLNLGPSEKFTCIPGAGVPTDDFRLSQDQRLACRARLRQELGLPLQATIMLSVSRLTWDKGYREMLDALALLRREGLEVMLVAAGSGKHEQQIQSAIAQAGLTEHVRLLGWREDTRQLYGAADAFVFASHREGLPISPIEAMASGLPVVLSDLPGCREEVDDGRCGMLFPVGDAAALADSLRYLLLDKCLRQRLARNGVRQAAAFDLQRVVQLQVDLYRECAALA